MAGPLSIGARVRIRRSLVPGVPELHEEGEAIRIDVRGVLVRLDSGRDVLVEPGMLTRLRVLVVDDDPLVLKAVGRMLGGIGEIESASGVAEATAKLGAMHFDAVLSDDKMPDGNGRGLLAMVRARYPNCRRLLMSGDDVPSERDLDPAYEYFIHKPFTAEAIVALLRPATAEPSEN